MGGAASAQVTILSDITFIYLNDGYKDSYLIIIHDGKVVQNLKLEQQILSGPEIENLMLCVKPCIWQDGTACILSVRIQTWQ